MPVHDILKKFGNAILIMMNVGNSSSLSIWNKCYRKYGYKKG